MSSSTSAKATLSVQPVSVEQAFVSYPELWDLAQRYAVESGAPEFGGASVQLARYTQLEQAGCGRGFVLLDGAQVVGLLFVVIAPVPHHKEPVAVVESIFALRGGSLLLQRAKEVAREAGAKVLHITAPTGGRLQRVLKRDTSARLASEVYVWKL